MRLCLRRLPAEPNDAALNYVSVLLIGGDAGIGESAAGVFRLGPFNSKREQTSVQALGSASMIATDPCPQTLSQMADV